MTSKGSPAKGTSTCKREGEDKRVKGDHCQPGASLWLHRQTSASTVDSTVVTGTTSTRTRACKYSTVLFSASQLSSCTTASGHQAQLSARLDAVLPFVHLSKILHRQAQMQVQNQAVRCVFALSRMARNSEQRFVCARHLVVSWVGLQ
jgi:hypothetical protein